jgi:hypothetical protein
VFLYLISSINNRTQFPIVVTRPTLRRAHKGLLLIQQNNLFRLLQNYITIIRNRKKKDKKKLKTKIKSGVPLILIKRNEKYGA